MGARSPAPRAADPFLTRLESALERLPPARAAEPRRFAVAFSGGLDSTVLLHALVRLALPVPPAALHVDHGLAGESADWERHCRRAAEALGLDYRARRVLVDAAAGTGPEAAARDARYAALAQMLEPGEILLTAHHADDQLETVLLRLLRGAGVRGLAATREWSPFARGYLARPLLDFTRAALVDRARQWRLEWLEDPSNAEQHFDRNYLRRRVVPPLLERWPSAAHAARRLAARMGDAEEVLEAMAVHDLGADADPARVPRAPLRALSAARQRNALRHAIARRGLPTPSAAQLEALRDSLYVVRADAQTRVAWPGAEARVYRDRLYLFAPLPPPHAQSRVIRLGERAAGAWGTLGFEPAHGAGGLPEPWLREGLELRLRRGGETLRRLGHAHTRPLRKLFQDAGIVPWMRDRIPLLYRDGALVAVGDLWLAESVAGAPAGEPRWRVVWTDHPPLV